MKKLLLLLILVGFSYNLFGQQTTLDEFLDSFTNHTNFNGTILINQDSKTIYHKSFGLANFEFEVPTNIKTKFKIASITKLFTSVLAMQLVEGGKIELNGKIKTYLPDYTGEGGEKVIVHQLLNHTSGLVNIDTISSMESALTSGIPLYQSPQSSDQLLSDFCSGNLVNEPRKVFGYNNADYIVLGKIIEKIYAKTYEQAIVENILMPIQMKNTGWFIKTILFKT
ncbi:serine hydrolase domain-containing protein [Algoriphagus sp. D3-2-R+10]|uniref:serine hydrolase domain-containing protein n=1 Tax=Algoriphagus aurantiacus TaxID=3103948 RepID=UPI002B3FA8C2|nr:serine hydrolase domain-containing protein [Algoriphagus sp. D3-2-R+10]MEB2776623.1 serine hydrolase domain-containing protein [Algoriphagus sp. D3-2-R+10]